MPDTNINRIRQYVASAPGTGSAVLGAAIDGFKALGSGQNGLTFSVLFVDGTAWEISTGCAYTHSTTTLTRGTLEDSSTGSRLTLSADANISIVLPASKGDEWDATASLAAGALQSANNLSDVASASTARSNLGAEASGAASTAVSAHVAAGDPHAQYALESSLGTAAYAATGDFATAAQGTDAREWTATTVTQAEAEAGTATTRRAWTAERIKQAILALAPSGGGGSGTKTLAVFTPMTSQPPASAFATLDTRNSIAVLDFDDASVESTTFVGVIPEAAVLTSGIIARLHWTATSATSGNVRWRVEFERAGTDIDADSFDTATEATSAANGTSGIESVAAITCTTIDSLAAGDRFRVRISRVGTDGTNDTMTGDAELIAVELRAA